MLSGRLGRSAAQSMRFSSQPAIRPRLPVPDLRKTLDKYLKSIQPFLLEDEARGGPSYEFSYGSRLKLAEEFENGVGRICQTRLLALDRTSPYNWLDDNFWIKKAYHEWRASLPINSNWWLALVNDNTIPEHIIHNQADGINPWQIRRAAWLVHRVLEYKDKLDSQALHHDTTRTGVWLCKSVASLFNISRIPQHTCDTFSSVPPPLSPNARKIIVMVNDFFYAIEVYDDQQRLIHVAEIERRVRAVVRDATQRLENGEIAVPVGILSADERNQWADNLQHLLSLSPTNENVVRAINESLFSLSLDDYTHTLSTSPSPINSQSEIDAHLHNIRSSRSGHNRWFDKALTLIVESNTRTGAMGEHSPCDALVPSIVAEYAIIQEIKSDAFADAEPPALILGQAITSSGWEKFEWVTDAKIRNECKRVEKRTEQAIADSDDSVLWFKDYGTDWIKGIMKLSPDAYIQMALQLAWYKARGSFTATYETVLTRMFERGRTETIRTFTTDSRAFVYAMLDPSSSAHSRYNLLRRAIQTHTTLTREAATGKGIDRHLMGLRLMVQGEQSDFFDDPMFTRSQEWKLSTSGLSAGHLFRGTGFGAVYHDGYGINYLAGPETVKFGIESKHSCSDTSTKHFKTIICQVLYDMRSVCLIGIETEGITTRL